MNLWIRIKEFFQDLPAALVILNPSKGIGLILRNCVHLDGRLSLTRFKAELFHLLFFIFVITAIPIFYIGSNIAIVWTVHKYVVPIPLAVKIFGSFNLDEEVWEAKIEHEIASMETLSKEYHQFSKKHGVSSETSQSMQKMLWHSWPLYLGLGLFFGITFYLVVVRFCLSTIRDYHNNLIRRKMTYFDRDLRVIPREKIL